jgi:CRISPR-associated protein Cas1
VYDLEEPFRWLIDISVIDALDSETLKLSDFYFTGADYRYRFEPEAKQRFIDLIRERFNSGVRYRGRVLRWDTIIEQRVNDLSRFYAGRSPKPDFMEPAPKVERQDNHELRAKILLLTALEAKRLGIAKSTLHYLRRNARSPHLFKVYGKTLMKVQST